MVVLILLLKKIFKEKHTFKNRKVTVFYVCTAVATSKEKLGFVCHKFLCNIFFLPDMFFVSIQISLQQNSFFLLLLPFYFQVYKMKSSDQVVCLSFISFQLKVEETV